MQPFIIVLKRKTLPNKILPLLRRTDEIYIIEHELLLRNDVSITPTSSSPPPPPPHPCHFCENLLASIMVAKLSRAMCSSALTSETLYRPEPVIILKTRSNMVYSSPFL